MHKDRADELARSENWQEFCRDIDIMSQQYKDRLATETDMNVILKLQAKIEQNEIIKQHPAHLAS